MTNIFLNFVIMFLLLFFIVFCFLVILWWCLRIYRDPTTQLVHNGGMPIIGKVHQLFGDKTKKDKSPLEKELKKKPKDDCNVDISMGDHVTDDDDFKVDDISETLTTANGEPDCIMDDNTSNATIESLGTLILPFDECDDDDDVYESLKNVSGIPKLSYEELGDATNNWSNSNLLGRGGFGQVFKGKWKQLPVAVKRLRQHRNKELLAEMCLNQYRHDNILPLYGYSLGASLEDPALRGSAYSNSAMCREFFAIGHTALNTRGMNVPLCWKFL